MEPLGAGLAVGLAGVGAGIGIGIGLRGAMEALGRNPDAENATSMIVGLGMAEAIGIYGFLIGLFLALGLGG